MAPRYIPLLAALLWLLPLAAGAQYAGRTQWLEYNISEGLSVRMPEGVVQESITGNEIIYHKGRMLFVVMGIQRRELPDGGDTLRHAKARRYEADYCKRYCKRRTAEVGKHTKMREWKHKGLRGYQMVYPFKVNEDGMLQMVHEKVFFYNDVFYKVRYLCYIGQMPDVIYENTAARFFGSIKTKG